MSNKLYNGNNTDYLIEGAGKKGYLKSSGKGYGDGKTSEPIKDYSDTTHGFSDNIFEGKKGSVGSGMKGSQGKF